MGHRKKLRKSKIQKQCEKDKIIKNIRNLFRQRKKMKKLKTKQLEILGSLLNKKVSSINQLEWVIFGTTVTSNMKVKVIKIKSYQ